MNKSFTKLICLGMILTGLLFSFACTGSLSGQTQVQIQLRQQIVTTEKVATLVELADLFGGPSTTRYAMGKLDFGVETGIGKSISKREVVARLMLAGFTEQQFAVTGAEKTDLLQTGSALGADRFVSSISSHVARAFGIPSEDVLVEITKLPELQPLPADIPVELRPLDHADQIIGNRSVSVGVFQGNQLLQQVRVVAKTSYLRDVLVTRIPIEKGEQLAPSNSFMKKTQFDRVNRIQPIDTSAHGKVTSRRIRGQQVIRASDIQTVKQIAETEIVIRPRALVTAVAKKGTLQVTMSGLEAMRSGKLGDTIPVKNLVTKKVIYGRIIDLNTVEVSF